ncbi:hypothetical protein V6N12_050219 [Hibiscus sabdariffa]|uniref:Uncharacterized protein n=1 Tax=Hibiscus sabdariffa TaxID=183260 RepID=A0ABR2GDG8_9ROSI
MESRSLKPCPLAQHIWGQIMQKCNVCWKSMLARAMVHVRPEALVPQVYYSFVRKPGEWANMDSEADGYGSHGFTIVLATCSARLSLQHVKACASTGAHAELIVQSLLLLQSENGC